jgi:hypothetical protein
VLATQIRDVVWAEDELREQFLAEGAAALGSAERDLIASWKHRVRAKFIIPSHLQKHSIFMSEGVYGVRGIYTPLDAMFPVVPMFVDAALVPFRDVIITDGLMQSPPMQLTFGGGARRAFKEQYSAARAAGQVRTCLPWQGIRRVEPQLRRRPRERRVDDGRGRHDGRRLQACLALGAARVEASDLGVDPVEETLGLRSMDRVVKSFVDPSGGQHTEPFHVSAALCLLIVLRCRDWSRRTPTRDRPPSRMNGVRSGCR